MVQFKLEQNILALPDNQGFYIMHVLGMHTCVHIYTES